MKMVDHVQNFFGLAAAVFLENLVNLKWQAQALWMSSVPTSPWKMNKAELVEKLESMGVPLRPDWTVPELRTTLMEELEIRGLNKSRLQGLTHLCLDDLKKKCSAEGIPLPEKVTRGVMIKLLRESVPPSAEEVVCFGSYKGFMYKEVNESYLRWAMDEVNNNPQHSADLARLARWAQARSSTSTTSRHQNPEAAPVVPMPSGALPRAKPKTNPPYKGSPVKTARTSRTRPLETKEDSTDFSEVDWPVDDQIKDMEARLEVLRTIKDQEEKVKAKAKAAPGRD